MVLGGTSVIGRVDFLFRAQGVVVEADGRKHHSALLDRDNDRWRDLALMAEGLLPIRVTWWDLVHRPDEFVAILRRILELRA